MDFSLPTEVQELRKSLRDFIEREIRPLDEAELDPENDHIPIEVWQKVRRRSAELGFYAPDFPEEYGGAGLTQVGMVALREEAARSGVRLAAGVCYGPEGPTGVLLDGTDEQMKKYLMPLITAEKSMAFALTEPDAGSDAQNIHTTATKDGNDWVLNGRKHFITNGKYADFVLVFAANDRTKKAQGGITAFLVEKGTPGFEVGRSQTGMVEGEGQVELIFDNCRVSEENVLGGPEKAGFGFYSAMGFLAMGRLSIAAMCNGIADYALNLGLEYAKNRVAFDRPIGKNQYVQGHIVDSLVEVKASRLMTYECAWKYDHGEEVIQESSIVKLYASEMVNRVAYRMIQVYGGMGWMREVPLERIYRLVRIFTLVEGTSEIQKYIIAKTLGL
ncbi:MAG: acyl-CoA dehydrogenase family protein [Actinomycetota bacterium]